jgi:hypothetical protein
MIDKAFQNSMEIDRSNGIWIGILFRWGWVGFYLVIFGFFVVYGQTHPYVVGGGFFGIDE